MNRKVEIGKTLLVDGPASVSIVSGKAQVFGVTIPDRRRIAIREGKRLPFFSLETAEFSIHLGQSAELEEVEGDTIPPSWKEAFEITENLQGKPAVIMTVGSVDSGKTSLCTYLANRLVETGHSVVMLDGDIGQSDIGPPCTVSYTPITEPITDLFALKPEDSFFVGVTSPSENTNRAIEGMAKMKAKATQCLCNFVIVNTDGWVLTEEAVAYKSKLAEKLEPDALICIEQSNELGPLIKELSKFRVISAKSPPTVRSRNREKRKSLRELGYQKYFAEAKVKAWPLKRLSLEQKYTCQSIEQKQGLLIGLNDARERLLGIGVLLDFDCVRQVAKILTSVNIQPTYVLLGSVRLDKDLHEIQD